MVFSPEWIIAYLVLGACVGFMAGLLGVGGGGIMVPLLTTFFVAQQAPETTLVHLALGTSMASIVITSLSSMRAHMARKGVLWDVVKSMAPGIIIGSFGATFLIKYLSSQALALFFALFMAYVAVQMFINRQADPSRKIPGKLGLAGVGSGIGSISALVSIGGGSLTVPFLTWVNVPIKKAIGTSAALGLPISVAGTIGYLINGIDVNIEVEWAVGFVYLPAVLCISITSVVFAPLGVKLTHRLPVAVLKKIFAFLSLSLSIKMLFSVF